MKFRVLIVFFFPFFLKSQTLSGVKFDLIKKAVADSTSVFYYPFLKNRFMKLDTSLTVEEFKYFYYGNVYQEYYSPYIKTDKELLFFEGAKAGKSAIEMEKLALDVLQENPVNLPILKRMIIAFNYEKNIEKAIVYSSMYVSFLEVIYGSGDGKTCESSFVVINVNDEYEIASDLLLTTTKQQLFGTCDRLIFSRKGQKRKDRIKMLFFNVQKPLANLSKSYNKLNLPEEELEIED